jgi:hypothetical protein
MRPMSDRSCPCGSCPARVPSSRRHGGALEVEHLAHVDAMPRSVARVRLDVIDDEERSLDRARRGCRESLAEHDGAR